MKSEVVINALKLALNYTLSLVAEEFDRVFAHHMRTSMELKSIVLDSRYNWPEMKSASAERLNSLPLLKWHSRAQNKCHNWPLSVSNEILHEIFRFRRSALACFRVTKQ